MSKVTFKEIHRKRDVAEEDSVMQQIRDEAREKAAKEALENNAQIEPKNLKDILFGG